MTSSLKLYLTDRPADCNHLRGTACGGLGLKQIPTTRARLMMLGVDPVLSLSPYLYDGSPSYWKMTVVIFTFRIRNVCVPGHMNLYIHVCLYSERQVLRTQMYPCPCAVSQIYSYVDVRPHVGTCRLAQLAQSKFKQIGLAQAHQCLTIQECSLEDKRGIHP